jgi:uncharacterized protein (DUF488 family)
MNSNKHFIFTFGYGNRRNHGELIEYLRKFQVKYVVDVRLTQRAWTRTWYGDKIQEACNKLGVIYIARTALGNTSGKSDWVSPNEQEAQIALNEIASIAQESNIILLCAELDYSRCHRQEVADQLSRIAEVPIMHLK